MRKFNFVISALVVFLSFNVNLYAATYTWNGGTNDGKWSTPENWTCTGTEYRWPNEQKIKFVNDDVDQIIIDNGNKVNISARAFCIDGPLDGSVAPALILDNGSTLTGRFVYLGDNVGTKGEIGIRDGATLVVEGKLDVGNDGYGCVFISGGHLIIKKSIGVGSGKYASGDMTVSGKSTVTVGEDFILSEAHSGKSKLTINGGVITVGGTFCLGGKYNSNDTTLCRVFLNGGVLKSENLVFKKMLSKIIYTGGELIVNSVNVSADDMENLITSGEIDVSGVEDWEIRIVNGYTVLLSK